MPTGRYIVIEGHDGTGKSTQIAQLADWLRQQGRSVTIVEEPGSDDPERSTPVATALRRVIVDGTLTRDPTINLVLFSAARRELWQHKIAPALASGQDVLCSRNYYSTIAYQGYGEGVPVADIEAMTRLFTSDRYMQPDIAVLLTLDDHSERSARIDDRGALATPDTFESKDAAFQQRVQAGYLRLASDYSLPIISAQQSIDAIARDIQAIVSRQAAPPL